MKKNLYWFIIFTCISLQIKPSSATFFKPVSYLPEVQPDDPDYASFTLEYSHGQAHESFNIYEKKAPLLSWHGTENLLNRLAYPEQYAYDDPSSVGKAHVICDHAGINELAFHASKNLSNGIFFAASIFVRDVTIYNIGFSVIKNEETDERYPTFINIPPDEMRVDPDLYNWCKAFPFLSGPQGNNANVRKYNLSNSFFKVGFTKKIQPLEILDYAHFTVQAGVMTPELFENYQSDSIHFYLGDRGCIGFCFETALLISYNKWTNIGFASSIITYLDNFTSEAPMSMTATNSGFFENNLAPADIQRQPFSYFNVHYEAHDIFDHLTIMLGFSYSKQRKTIVSPYDQIKYPKNIINKNSSSNQGWKAGSIHFELLYDFNTENKQDKPILSLSYTRPLTGRGVFISRIIAGSCNLSFRYKF